MRNHLFGIIALFAANAASAAPAEYQATVQQRYTAQRPVASIALAPFLCPRDMDCKDLEKEIITLLSEHKNWRVVEPLFVRELMDQASVSDLQNHEGRMIIGEGLDVDAFVFVKVKEAKIEVAAVSANDKWKDLKKESSVKRASIELRVVTRDGVQLAQVSGEAQIYNTIKSMSTIGAKLFAEMLERAWP